MIVTGIDLASVHSAVCTIEVPERTSFWEPTNWEVKELDWIDVKEDTTAARIRAAYAIGRVMEQYKPDLVAVEDFTHQRKSFDSYNAGELGGMVRLLLWQGQHRYLLVSPMRLKTFLHIYNKTPIHKDAVAFAVQAYFGYKSDASRKKRREDAVDAFALAQLARAFLSYQSQAASTCHDWANAKQRKVLEALWEDTDLLVQGSIIDDPEVKRLLDEHSFFKNLGGPDSVKPRISKLVAGDTIE